MSTSTRNFVKARTLVQVIPAQETRDGDGVLIYRIAGRQFNVRLDPFLLIDELRSEHVDDYGGGFPNHPHRGFETLTYMLKGQLEHGDHMGNSGVVSPGGAQWMTAGKGIIHSEMPRQKDGEMHAFQLWLNLPAEQKMIAPGYRDVDAESMGRFISRGDDVDVTAVAGSCQLDCLGESTEISGPVQTVTDATILDIRLQSQAELQVTLPDANNLLVYVMHGATDELVEQQLGVYEGLGAVTLNAASSGARILLLSGRPLQEPVVQYGPFVMNTMEEIQQAVREFQEGRLVSSSSSS